MSELDNHVLHAGALHRLTSGVAALRRWAACHVELTPVALAVFADATRSKAVCKRRPIRGCAARARPDIAAHAFELLVNATIPITPLFVKLTGAQWSTPKGASAVSLLLRAESDAARDRWLAAVRRTSYADYDSARAGAPALRLNLGAVTASGTSGDDDDDDVEEEDAERAVAAPRAAGDDDYADVASAVAGASAAPPAVDDYDDVAGAVAAALQRRGRSRDADDEAEAAEDDEADSGAAEARPVRPAVRAPRPEMAHLDDDLQQLLRAHSKSAHALGTLDRNALLLHARQQQRAMLELAELVMLERQANAADAAASAPPPARRRGTLTEIPTDAKPPFNIDAELRHQEPPYGSLQEALRTHTFYNWCRDVALVEENVEFYLSIESFRDLPSAVRKTKAREIIQYFVLDGAPRQINIEDHVRKTLLGVAHEEHVARDLFVAAADSLFQVLRRDIWPRFAAENAATAKTKSPRFRIPLISPRRRKGAES